MKCLTLVSRYFANTLKNYIERNLWFDLSNGRRLTHYTSLNQKNVLNISEILPSAKKLAFNRFFNDPVDNVLHDGITHIQFGREFNYCVDHLPSSLTHLSFDSYFNQTVNRLPHSLIHLKFSIFFNQTIDELPPQLTHLTLGFHFDKDVEKLPSSLTHLEMGNNFNYRVSVFNLPSNLTHIEFGSKFTRTIPSLPPKVKQVIFGQDYRRDVTHLDQ
eukprot:TRINITY_DN634_c0_g4_i1.p1 TRINITY_DN634_c0_g4~~TRINITY_DN634_c0_g4_i1.p1  ORF type:complete len:235 (-),score=34.32 TRINITY_DN634_c0_g4_i1:8-655(-)